MIGVLTCPSPKGDGIVLNLFLCPWRVEFPKIILFEEGLGFSPSGDEYPSYSEW
jgi:hypothetical protein